MTILALSGTREHKAGSALPAWMAFFNQIKDLPTDTKLSWTQVGVIFGCDAVRADHSYRGSIKRAAVELQKYGRDCVLCGGAGVLIK